MNLTKYAIVYSVFTNDNKKSLNIINTFIIINYERKKKDSNELSLNPM